MNQLISIVTDSSVDLPAAETASLGIETAPLQVAFSTEFFRDDALDRAEFYRRLKDEPRLPTIAAAMPTDFLAAYRKAHDRAERVLCLINPFESCSTYTAAYSAAVVAKRDSKIDVEVMNTGRALTALGAVAIGAAEMAARGAELKDIIGAIEEATPQIDSFYAPATSEYLRRDGRISLYEMNVGPLRGMLPLIRVWGRIAVIGKARTQAENIAKMLELAQNELGRKRGHRGHHARQQSRGREEARRGRARAPQMCKTGGDSARTFGRRILRRRYGGAGILSEPAKTELMEHRP